MGVSVDLSQSHLSERHKEGSEVSGSKFFESSAVDKSIERVRKIAK